MSLPPTLHPKPRVSTTEGCHRLRTSSSVVMTPALPFSLRSGVPEPAGHPRSPRAVQVPPRPTYPFTTPTLAPGLRGADRGGDTEMRMPSGAGRARHLTQRLCYSVKSSFLTENNTLGPGVGPEALSSRPLPDSARTADTAGGFSVPILLFHLALRE